MTRSRTMAGAWTLVTFLLLATQTACSAGSEQSTSEAPDATIAPTSFAVPAAELPAATVPTAQQVTAMLHSAFDPDVRLAERAQFFEGATTSNPSPADHIGMGVTDIDVVEVVPIGPGQLSAATTSDRPGIPLIAEGGTWRIGRAWACAQLGARC